MKTRQQLREDSELIFQTFVTFVEQKISNAMAHCEDSVTIYCNRQQGDKIARLLEDRGFTVTFIEGCRGIGPSMVIRGL